MRNSIRITGRHLPQETINRIFGYLEGHTNTLISCSLASRQFVHPALSRLYRRCSLEIPEERPLNWKDEEKPRISSKPGSSGSHPLIRFVTFLATARCAPSYIRELRVTPMKNNTRHSMMALNHLQHILSLLPELQGLRLERVCIYVFPPSPNVPPPASQPRRRYRLRYLALLDTVNFQDFLQHGRYESFFNLLDTFEHVDVLELKALELYSQIKGWPQQSLSLEALRIHVDSQKACGRVTSFDYFSALVSSSQSFTIDANVSGWNSHRGIKRLVSDKGQQLRVLKLTMMLPRMLYFNAPLLNPSFNVPVPIHQEPYIINLSNCMQLETVQLIFEVLPMHNDEAAYYAMTTHIASMLRTLPKRSSRSTSPNNRNLLLIINFTNLEKRTIRVKLSQGIFNWEALDKSFKMFRELSIWLRYKTVGNLDIRSTKPRITLESSLNDDPKIHQMFRANLPSLKKFGEVFVGDPLNEFLQEIPTTNSNL
ncbi:hypothetical protein ABKN59_009444 [Abortiporus biennis]